MVFLDVLARERTIAEPGYNRWLLPPCALAIHLCIGMCYGFSVFWKPLGSLLVGPDGGPLPACAAGFSSTLGGKLASTGKALFATDCNWTQFDLGWLYSMFFIVLGISAGIFGSWLEVAGPRKAALAATFCWCGGLVMSSAGVYYHQLWMLWLGSGLIGGVGIGLGYISPVSTLIKWFPDRRGLATGMAIMGFGGGAMVGSPFAAYLMTYFATPGDPTNPGVWQTFLVLAGINFVYMTCGAFGYRVPAQGWKPEGWNPPEEGAIKGRSVHISKAAGTPQFWLLMTVLFMHIAASIGIVGAAAPMLLETFGGALVGHKELSFSELKGHEDLMLAAAAVSAGFVGLVSLFNISGRIMWASASDLIGRKLTYVALFVIGMGLYFMCSWAVTTSVLPLFVACVCIVAWVYGGGFATIPAYIADLFGTQFVGAIHGRVLVGWSCAGVVGPMIVNYMHDMRMEEGVPSNELYAPIFIVMAGILGLGFVANLFVRPIADHHFMISVKDEPEMVTKIDTNVDVHQPMKSTSPTSYQAWMAIPPWLAVGIPLMAGIANSLKVATKMFAY